ncbi:DUF6792 domain-containing protein [Latilactobacillus graminis]|uniref:DUF6792 domain-containing protein n=2 Tax=Latilactobacillus graminis TaxID=60519 RepID=A0AA89I0X9_9LACO|nr:DUF6792 domain-containing protein [Latilactobacillus graminis]KRM23290.1 hypothetical protein FC90_GL000389 [Latilactobacillus graminis DSM 20719]QFP78949.1 hypothetical protein LG542_01285 [Latilactobacillus graminis]
MGTTAIIAALFRLVKVYDDLGRLLFKAHLDVPLTFDREQSQALLRRNNRLEFSYQQLKASKTKLLNQLLATARSDSYLWGKLRRLKALDAASLTAIQTSPQFKRRRKINRLKQLIVNLQNEKINESSVLTKQILAYLYHRAPEKVAAISKPGPVYDDPFTSRAFRMDMMALNYLDQYFNVQELQYYVQYLVFIHAHQQAEAVIHYDARTILPNAGQTGFSAVAYYITINQQAYTYISYKGTEGTMDDPRIKSFTQRLDHYVRESYQDWKYNIDAMLIGNTDNDEQLQLARRFTRYVVRRVRRINPATVIYGLGHSLGGHFVQTIQLLDEPFDGGYTLNAAPVQLKQIKHYRPDLLTDSAWQQLFMLTKQNNTQDPTVVMQVQAILGQRYDTIENEWFIKDLTRIYFNFPYTFYIGTAQYLNAKNWQYPFVVDVAPYLQKDEIHAYNQFWDNLIHHLQRVEMKNGSLMLASLMTYGLQTLRELYGAIKTDQAQQIFTAYARYLYDAHIFKDTPVQIQANFERELSRPKTALRVLRGEWPFLKSINHEMVEAVIFFHTIEGAQYFTR